MSTGGAFFDQFIEDYFSECDEHLASARRVLLALESASTGALPPPPLHDLRRSLHTLKGLSGMVGDTSAERVSHALEDALRGADRTGTGSTSDPAFLDLLFAGVDAIERCVAAHRAGEPSPDLDALLGSLGRVTGAPAEEPLAPASSPSDEARGVVYEFEFLPSAALTARGVGVDAVRARMRALGTLLDAKPRVVPGGVAFDFRVAVPVGVKPDDRWSDDGLRWTVAGTRIGALTDDDARTATDEPSRADAIASAGYSPFAGGGGASASVVRADLGRLDDVMRLVGDLVTCRSRLDEVVRQASAMDQSALLDELAEVNAGMERQLRQLREGVMRIRLVQVGEVFERLRFAARDAIRESGKRVRLVLHGESTEIDKVVVDRMLEPLLHLVRNAVSHGIERPAERTAAGKPAEGTLSLRANASGDRIRLVVEDDGAGIDVDAVARRAGVRGLLVDDAPLTDERLLDVLCAPGFSTRDEADRTSGRGVGMDVVRSAVRALSGDLSVESAPGRGTCFTIELPLSLMILDALLVDVGGQRMAVPQPALREVVQVDVASIVTFENNEVVRYRDGVLPIVHLARLFDFPASGDARCYLLVVGSEAAPMGLRVDRLIGLREIVVHPVADPLVAMPGVAGATDLGNGRVSLILDTVALLRMAEEQRAARAAARLTSEPTGARRPPRWTTIR